MSLQAGQILDGKYRIVRTIGTGGMGAVYEGENIRIRRRVAIKVLHPQVSLNEESLARFQREAQAAGRIGSDHICEVLDLGALTDGTHYMVLEYLEGETLSARIKRHGRLLPDHVAPIMIQVLEGLGAAHAAGIIHRDLKPDNIFILRQKTGRSDFVKLLDFGVSKFAHGDDMSMTRSGAVVGTPYYMSPEQARGTPAIDPRTDIYAMGVILYQAMTGRVPFQAASFNELLFKIALEAPPPPQHHVPDLDPQFAAIILHAMARDPGQRFRDCAEFRDALLTWLAARTAPVPISSPVAAQLAAMASNPGGVVTPQGLMAAPGMAPPPISGHGPMTPPHNQGIPMPSPSVPGHGVPASAMVTPHGLGPMPMMPPHAVLPPHAAMAPMPPPSASGSQIPLSSSSSGEMQLATGNTWGQASPVPATSQARGWLAIGALALLIAGGLTAYLVRPRPHVATDTAPASEATAPIAAEPAAAEPTAAAPQPEVPTTVVAAPSAATDATDASAASVASAVASTTRPAARQGAPQPPRRPPAATAKPASKPDVSDLGY